MAVQTSPDSLVSTARSKHWDWLEPLLAVLVFLLPLLGNLPFGKANSWVAVPIALLTAAAFIAGLVMGLPRWSMPAVGLLLFVLTFYGSALLLQQLQNLPIAARAQSRALDAREAYALVTDGLFWLIYLLVSGLMVLAARALLHGLAETTPHWWPKERDWTWFSFLLYGANSAILLLTLDDYESVGPLTLIVVVVLIAGALSYLRAEQPHRRIQALVGAALLAGMILAAGKWVLIPLQTWSFWFKLHPPEIERWFVAISTLHNAIYNSMVLALPGLLLRRGRPFKLGDWGLHD